MHPEQNAILKRFANILALLNKYMLVGNFTLVQFMVAKVKTKAGPKNSIQMGSGNVRHHELAMCRRFIKFNICFKIVVHPRIAHIFSEGNYDFFPAL